MCSVEKNPEETHIFAILYPAKGKMPRLKELMDEHIAATHKNEDYTVRYLMTEDADSEEPALHMLETYTSKEGADKHTKTKNFAALMEATEKEKVWRQEPYLKFTKTIGGFDWDRKCIQRRS